MTTTGRKAFWVGLLTAVAFGTIGLGIFVVGQEQSLWHGRTTYHIRFARADGLQQAAPVTLNGVNVGSVRRIRFPKQLEDSYVDATLSISDDVTPRIRRDTIGRIQTLGLLGDKYIQLSGGSMESEVLDPGGLLQSENPVDYEAILGRSGDVVSNAIEVSALLKDVLIAINSGQGLVGRLLKDDEFGEGAIERFHQTMDSLQTTIETIQSASARLDGVLARVERGEGAIGVLLQDDETVRATLDNLHDASVDASALAKELHEGEGVLRRLASDRELADRVLADLESTSENLATISEDVAAISEQVRSGEGTMGKLVYDDSLYKGADALVGGESGGFWRLLGRLLWPFSASRDQAPAEAGAVPAEAGAVPAEAVAEDVTETAPPEAVPQYRPVAPRLRPRVPEKPR